MLPTVVDEINVKGDWEVFDVELVLEDVSNIGDVLVIFVDG